MCIGLCWKSLFVGNWRKVAQNEPQIGSITGNLFIRFFYFFYKVRYQPQIIKKLFIFICFPRNFFFNCPAIWVRISSKCTRFWWFLIRFGKPWILRSAVGCLPSEGYNFRQNMGPNMNCLHFNPLKRAARIQGTALPTYALGDSSYIFFWNIVLINIE